MKTITVETHSNKRLTKTRQLLVSKLVVTKLSTMAEYYSIVLTDPHNCGSL